jgi:cytidine deaminase
MYFNDPQSHAWEALVAAAWRGWENAHAPYSSFRVGAALLLQDGTIVEGCNVENASYPVSLCAERGALSAAVARGLKPGGLRALVVATESSTLAPPCGACRQALVEFAQVLPILLVNRNHRTLHALEDLLPHPFSGGFLAN